MIAISVPYFNKAHSGPTKVFTKRPLAFSLGLPLGTLFKKTETPYEPLKHPDKARLNNLTLDA